MYLNHLSLTNFRNFSRLDFDIPRGAVLLVGGNAQGKTSLLEAIYFLSALTSFHAESDRQVINFIAARTPLAVARIVADFVRAEQKHRLEVRVIQEPNGLNGTRLRKEVLLDRVKQSIGDAVGQFNAVLFLPQMLHVVEGSPEERRRYLNMGLAQVVRGYARALSTYNRLLRQRNALLKQLGEKGGSTDQLDIWDEQLALSGAFIIFQRIHAVLELGRLAARVHNELTRGQEVLRLDYSPAYDPLPIPEGQYSLPLDAPLDRSGISQEEIAAGFQAALHARREEEIQRGMTTIGPHRDELRFLSNGVDLKIYGSRGQIRTAMLSLKLGEVSWIREEIGHWPVLLLDEVLAELDTERRRDLLSRIVQTEQALLTTTDPDLFTPEFIQQACLWHIRDGQLTSEPGRTSDE